MFYRIDLKNRDIEGLKKGKELAKKWAFRFLSLRTKWIKLNQGKSKRSEATVKAFEFPGRSVL